MNVVVVVVFSLLCVVTPLCFGVQTDVDWRLVPRVASCCLVFLVLLVLKTPVYANPDTPGEGLMECMNEGN